MSAGEGILHSEFNASKTEPLRFLQVWIIPEVRGIPPAYEQRAFSGADKRGRLKLIGSKDGRDGSIAFRQDVSIYASVLDRGDRVEHRPAPGRALWLQIARGSVDANGMRLEEGDSLSLVDEGLLTITGAANSELLLFDL